MKITKIYHPNSNDVFYLNLKHVAGMFFREGDMTRINIAMAHHTLTFTLSPSVKVTSMVKLEWKEYFEKLLKMWAEALDEDTLTVTGDTGIRGYGHP